MQLELFARAPQPGDLAAELATFTHRGQPTRIEATDGVPVFRNEFWTRRQRAAQSLHEISYRACFKPALPRFFVERLTRPGARVHDPFMGRGTTLLEAALLDRVPSGGDVNPLGRILVGPRLRPPVQQDVAARLDAIDFAVPQAAPDELLAFFHPQTLQEIAALRAHLLQAEPDPVGDWIRMVALNRLTGHSPGFFSVYTLPPNQAVSVQSQRRINARRAQTPPRRDVRALILRKSQALLRDVDPAGRARLHALAARAQLLVAPADAAPQIESASVDLVVTSPPFLDVVDYAGDNWLRCWFCGIDPADVAITMARKVDDWRAAMTAALRESARMLRPGGHVAFEVGEVRGGGLPLEREVIPAARAAGLAPLLVLINEQPFTKTANCWGVTNNRGGTNSNRVVLLRRD